MTKKVVLVAVIALIAVGGVFAESAWGGGLSFETGTVSQDDQGATAKSRVGHAFGGFVFYDMGYFTGSFGFSGGPLSMSNGTEETVQIFGLDFAIMAKVPIELGNNMTVYPIVGPAFSTVLFSQDKLTENAKFSLLKMNIGFGGDVEITNNTFLRTEILGQYRYEPSIFTKKDRNANTTSGRNNYSGYGLNVRIAAGMKL